MTRWSGPSGGSSRNSPDKDHPVLPDIHSGNREPYAVPGFSCSGFFENTRFRDMIMVQEHRTEN